MQLAGSQIGNANRLHVHLYHKRNYNWQHINIEIPVLETQKFRALRVVGLLL